MAWLFQWKVRQAYNKVVFFISARFQILKEITLYDSGIYCSATYFCFGRLTLKRASFKVLEIFRSV